MNRLDARLGQLMTDPGVVKNEVKGLSGDTGLMLFGDQQSGELMNIDGRPLVDRPSLTSMTKKSFLLRHCPLPDTTLNEL